jgi:hypothetical protein
MKKISLSIGINNYPESSNDLNGCVNDANDWQDLLKSKFDFQNNTLLLDEQATKHNVLNNLQKLISNLGDGDVGVFTFSGHGTWVYDNDSDEADNRDEAICAYDENILDDDIRKILLTLNPKARLTIISDSCHSGTVTRKMLSRQALLRSKSIEAFAIDGFENIDSNSLIPRYMPPKNSSDAIKTLTLPIRKRFLYPESNMSELLLTGCNATEYSYDAYINNRFNGAFTAFAIGIIKSNPNLTYKELHNEIRTILPNNRYPQSPQLEGNNIFKNFKLFS